MFTGIITDVGRILAVALQGAPPHGLGSGVTPETAQAGARRVRIECAYDMEKVDLGASIACSGVCLTVVDKGPDWFAVDVSNETLSRTAPGMWEQGRRLNLERPLRLGDELGGHIVTGHVDGLGTVSWAGLDEGSIRFSIKAPKRLGSYISEKGSIAIDGISLTVNEVEDREDGTYFGVNVIPHTADNTALFDRGNTVNLEIDVLARYIGRMLEARG
jgi:riboflavin synthase